MIGAVFVFSEGSMLEARVCFCEDPAVRRERGEAEGLGGEERRMGLMGYSRLLGIRYCMCVCVSVG